MSFRYFLSRWVIEVSHPAQHLQFVICSALPLVIGGGALVALLTSSRVRREGCPCWPAWGSGLSGSGG
jgi:hypothetical protein